MLLDRSKSILVFVDVQPRILSATKDYEQTLTNAKRLAEAAQILNVMACSTEQNSIKLGPGEAELTSFVQRVFHKMSFGAAGSTEFCHWLESEALLMAGASLSQPSNIKHNGMRDKQIVIAGCETHICLLQTAIQLKELGYEVYVVSDASGSRITENHKAGLARLAAARCHVVTTEMVLFEWLATADHASFKSVQSLIK